MELKEFIAKTILDIIEGIDSASNHLRNKNKEVGLYSTGKENQRHVEFDVAVTVSNKEGGSADGGGKINVVSVFQVGANAQLTYEETDSTVSRIKFGVRINDINTKKTENN